MGGETTRVENRGETTRGEMTRGETYWGRNVLLPLPQATRQADTMSPARHTDTRDHCTVKSLPKTSGVYMNQSLLLRFGSSVLSCGLGSCTGFFSGTLDCCWPSL